MNGTEIFSFARENETQISTDSRSRRVELKMKLLIALVLLIFNGDVGAHRQRGRIYEFVVRSDFLRGQLNPAIAYFKGLVKIML